MVKFGFGLQCAITAPDQFATEAIGAWGAYCAAVLGANGLQCNASEAEYVDHDGAQALGRVWCTSVTNVAPMLQAAIWDLRGDMSLLVDVRGTCTPLQVAYLHLACKVNNIEGDIEEDDGGVTGCLYASNKTELAAICSMLQTVNAG